MFLITKSHCFSLVDSQLNRGWKPLPQTISSNVTNQFFWPGGLGLFSVICPLTSVLCLYAMHNALCTLPLSPFRIPTSHVKNLPLSSDTFSYLLKPIKTTPRAIRPAPAIFWGACASFSQNIPSRAEKTMLTSRAATT